MNALKLLVTVALLATLVACGSDKKEPEPSAIEQAGREAGQAAAKELHEPIDKAKQVQEQMNQQAEKLDEQVDEQSSADKP